MFEKAVKFKKPSVGRLCTISMLVAVTAVLSVMSGYLRIGSFGKISISFFSVYIAAAMFGPFTGGLVGAVADFVSYVVNPIGIYLWPLAIIEYAVGFVFGLFFFSKTEQIKKTSFTKTILCVLVLFAVNAVPKTLVLMHYGYAPSNYTAAFLLRLPSNILTMIIQFVVINSTEKNLPALVIFFKKQGVIKNGKK